MSIDRRRTLAKASPIDVRPRSASLDPDPSTAPAKRSSGGPRVRRYNADQPCPICKGYEGARRGQGVRCTGFLSEDGEWARCSREEHAGRLPLDAKTTPASYRHRLNGECNCGRTHGHAPSRPTRHARAARPQPLATVAAEFVYEAADGTPYQCSRRFDNDDGKSFVMCRLGRIGKDGKPLWLSGLDKQPTIPYRLPQLVKADPSAVVFIVEGERKVDALMGGGLVATCNPMGAKKWRDEFSPFLDGRHVVILPDNDEVGRAHAELVAGSIAPHAASVKVVELPDLPAKGDIIDWLEMGRTLDEMRAIAARAPRREGHGDPPTPADRRTGKARSSNGHTGNGIAPPIVGPPPGPTVATPGGFHRTDLGNAERLIARHGRDLRYCYPWSRWLVWDGKRWALDDSGEAHRRVKDTVRAIYAEAAGEPDSERRKAIATFGFASEKHSRMAAMLARAEAEAGVPILPENMDVDPWLLNCRNGTVDLRTGRLRPHDRADLLTKMAPVDFDPDAKCPLFMDTLDRFLVSEEMIAFWVRLCGMAITGVVEDHILPIAYGTGFNGKSTILGVLLDVLGPDYAMKAMPDLLIAKKNDGHPTDRADLFGKRVVVAIETEDGQRLNESLVKELTGGDRIRARRMREDPWEFAPTHTVFLATNHKPQVRGTDHGIWRRLKLVPFSVRMPASEAKKDAPRLLREELPGILALMVRGCLAWQADGLKTPETVTEATNRYREDEDTLGAFIDEHCIVHQGAKVKAGALYAHYKTWSETSGIPTVSLVKFGKAIEERGHAKARSGGIWYHGIGLRDGDGDAP